MAGMTGLATGTVAGAANVVMGVLGAGRVPVASSSKRRWLLCLDGELISQRFLHPNAAILRRSGSEIRGRPGVRAEIRIFTCSLAVLEDQPAGLVEAEVEHAAGGGRVVARVGAGLAGLLRREGDGRGSETACPRGRCPRRADRWCSCSPVRQP